MAEEIEIKPRIEESWLRELEGEFKKPYFIKIKQFLQAEKNAGKTVYPPGSLIFHAFNSTPFSTIKVVIIGQDPYHGPGQAHGLCFSVPKGTPPPPSLVNIFKEIENDLGVSRPSHGNLQGWADQGVLLLNAFLTVRAHEAASHSKIGWEDFTDRVIQNISEKKEGVVFLLWGGFARKKALLIDKKKHHVLEAAHPSPLSAHNGFFGCRHFSITNRILERQQQSPIQWKIE